MSPFRARARRYQLDDIAGRIAERVDGDRKRIDQSKVQAESRRADHAAPTALILRVKLACRKFAPCADEQDGLKRNL